MQILYPLPRSQAEKEWSVVMSSESSFSAITSFNKISICALISTAACAHETPMGMAIIFISLSRAADNPNTNLIKQKLSKSFSPTCSALNMLWLKDRLSKMCNNFFLIGKNLPTIFNNKYLVDILRAVLLLNYNNVQHFIAFWKSWTKIMSRKPKLLRWQLDLRVSHEKSRC